MRHPLLRIQSICKFKRQINDGTVTSINANNMSFDEWVSHHFSDAQEINHISNAQTRILGTAYRLRLLIRRKPDAMEYDINQAIRSIKNVTSLARTEFFNEDVGRFPEILRKYGIEFKFVKMAPENTTSDRHRKSVSERLDKIKLSRSGNNYKKLLVANKQDFRLFDKVSELIEGAS